MENKITGRVFILGDNIDTDIIIPTQYMTVPSIEEMCAYAFSPIRPKLEAQIKQGDILIAGNNFGCGSSREQAPEIIRALGVAAVIAKSFARIFYRNAINNGLLVIENRDVQKTVKEGERISVYLMNSEIQLPDDSIISFGKIPEILLSMIDAGGLVSFYRKKNKGITS